MDAQTKVSVRTPLVTDPSDIGPIARSLLSMFTPQECRKFLDTCCSEGVDRNWLDALEDQIMFYGGPF